MTSENQIVDVLKELGTFYYLPNAGNLGDQVIAYATREFFRKNGLNFLPYSEKSEKEEPDCLVYGGGGAFVPYHGMIPALMKFLSHSCWKRIVILPSSFYGCDEFVDFLDERFTVFCREEQSLRYLTARNTRARVMMGDDMVFSLRVNSVLDNMPGQVTTHDFFRKKIQEVREHLHVLEDGRKVLFLLRSDNESCLNLKGTDGKGKIFDLSCVSNENAENEIRNRLLTCLFLHGINQADIVLTDRLHGAICSALLGKETWMLDNNYGKVSGVHAYSMKDFAHVSLLASPKDFPYENSVFGKAAKNERRKVKILVGICSAHGYYERRKAVRETWLKHPQEGVECLFFLGGDVPEREREDTVGLDAADSYIDLPAKVLAFFRYALEHYEFDWLFKCDEDTYLDLSRLPELADPQYGIIGDVLLERRNSPSGGAGYLLKREIVERIVNRTDVPLRGAEDLIFGKLALEEGAVPHSTPRLYMSNAHYPAPDNDEVSAHWCNPALMRVLELLRHGQPDMICRASHQYWKDDLLFYKEGVFRRRSTPCYGWWSMAADGILTLRWKMWGEEQLMKEGRKFSGSSLEIEPQGEGTIDELQNGLSDSLDEKAQPQKVHDRMERLHLGCGNRLLPGWLNLDLPRYDITRPLPWKDGSVRAYYLEHVIEYVSQTSLCRFLREVWRTLRPDGVLRLAITDRALHADGVRLHYAPFRQRQTGVNEGSGWELEALIEQDGARAFWVLESLSLFLKMAGFDVTRHEPGQSDDPALQGLERQSPPDEDPFLLMGTVCLEARKPKGASPMSFRASRATETRSLDSDEHNPEDDLYVSPFFCTGSRTGNRLFQIAAVYAHSLRYGLECRVPWRCRKEISRLYDMLGSPAGVCPDGGYTGSIAYSEPRFCYTPIPEAVRQGLLNGYFQSEKYFADCGKEIRALYARLTAPRREGEAGVHVRMGDYLKMSHQFRSPDAEFLEEAISRLSKDIRVLHVFSDNPGQALQLVRSVPAARKFELVLNEEDTLGALRSLSGMQELVMSCSSFSWWAAYLGEPDQVIVQKDWFAGVISDYQDVYRTSWIKL